MIVRYMIIAAKEMSQLSDKESAAFCILRVGLEEEQYRLGHTKVFFRTGVLGFLEDKRDERIQVLVSLLQGQCRAYIGLKNYRKLCEQRQVKPTYTARFKAERCTRMYTDNLTGDEGTICFVTRYIKETKLL